MANTEIKYHFPIYGAIGYAIKEKFKGKILQCETMNVIIKVEDSCFID